MNRLQHVLFGVLCESGAQDWEPTITCKLYQMQLKIVQKHNFHGGKYIAVL